MNDEQQNVQMIVGYAFLLANQNELLFLSVANRHILLSIQLRHWLMTPSKCIEGCNARPWPPPRASLELVPHAWEGGTGRVERSLIVFSG